MPVPWYDNWKLTTPEPRVVHKCEVCGYGIKKGELFYKVDGAIICDDSQCFERKAREMLEPEEYYA